MTTNRENADTATNASELTAPSITNLANLPDRAKAKAQPIVITTATTHKAPASVKPKAADREQLVKSSSCALRVTRRAFNPDLFLSKTAAA